MPKPPPPQLFTLNEACGRLRIGRSTMYKLLRNRELVPTRIGRNLKFTERELERFIDRKTMARK